MTSASNRNVFQDTDATELEAQRMACGYLVKGCERALFQFGLVAGETGGAAAVRVDEGAIEIMQLC
jgi:hypothetical protein